MNPPLHGVSRRHALKQTFFFSAALALGARAPFVRAEDLADGGHQFLMIGDFGIGNKDQAAVAKAMQDYAQALKFTPDGLFLVGDNFYGAFPEGLDSPRWKTEFEDMYPAQAFPGPCWAILGNHDYDNEPVTKVKAELAYHTARPGTRWTMPAKWYRFEWPEKPVMTCLMLDSNYKNSVDQLTPAERAEQLKWLKAELTKPRKTPWLVAMGHHPLYNNGHHGDRPDLIAEWGPLFQQHGVDFYFCGHDHDLQHIEFAGKRTSFVLSGAGGQSLHDVNVNARGPFGLKVHGFTHLQVNKDKFTVRHLDADRKQVHAFSKTPAGKIEFLS